MKYYIIKVEHKTNGGSWVCNGEYNAHNHDRAQQFTTDVIAYLATKHHYQTNELKQVSFRSNQSSTDSGKVFLFKSSQQKWVYDHSDA